jgi:hypothetical protein
LKVLESTHLVGMEEFSQGFCCATLKDQPAEISGGILLRYRLSGNSHPGYTIINVRLLASVKSEYQVQKMPLCHFGPFEYLRVNSGRNLF